MNLTHEDVQEIVRLLEDSSFDELILENERFKLTLRRATSGWTQETQTARDEAMPPASVTNGASIPAALEPGIAAVYPPLVGTFYRAPKPGAAPFVEPGSRVEEETVVAIIETMKLMNSVHAGVRGTVTEVCAENAEFVEHGRILMKVREDA
jgi:acetyl-CoA carboxylase biotin carboxyl carrier protein